MVASLPFVLALALCGVHAPGAWRIEVATHGGFSVRGAGAVKIRSSGDAEIVTPSGRRCGLKLDGRLLEGIARAVRSARPKRWHSRYFLPDNPTGCCDQVSTTLALIRSVGRAETRFVTGWFDESRQLAPRDALAVHDAAMEVALTHEGCRSD